METIYVDNVCKKRSDTERTSKGITRENHPSSKFKITVCKLDKKYQNIRICSLETGRVPTFIRGYKESSSKYQNSK